MVCLNLRKAGKQGLKVPVSSMEELRFPKFSEHHSSVELKELLVWIVKAGHYEGTNQDRFKNLLRLCQYTCILPQWSLKNKPFCQHYEGALIDLEATEILKSDDFFKWSQFITSPSAVFVPDDGHSLYHAVSTAMWGIKDNHNSIERLMKRALPEMTKSLLNRGQISHAALKLEEKQAVWPEILSKREGKSSGGSEAYESIAIFVLANVIRRPIIVIECSSGATAYSPGSVDMEGIYLPLEKSSSDCFKSPVILSYRDGHFNPLMFQGKLNQEAVFPLSKGDLRVLSVKYIREDQNSASTIQQYLNVLEISVALESGVKLAILCCQLSLNSLPEHLDSINIHFRKCQDIFQDYLATNKLQKAEKQKVSVPPDQHGLDANPFHHIDESNQTYLVASTSRETTPQKHVNGAYTTELKSIPLFSADKEYKKQHCGNGSPLDLECNKSFLNKHGEQYSNQTATATHFFNLHERPHGTVLHPPSNKNDGQGFIGKNRLPQQEDENESKLLSAHLCLTEGCFGLQQNNSTLCVQCLRKSERTGNGSTIRKVEHPQLGQAECLSQISDEDVIEVSEPPPVKYDVHKCASPVCHTIISSSQKLCEDCQAILISHSKHAGHSSNSEYFEGAKNDWENQRTVSNFRAGTFSGVIGRTKSLSAAKQNQKAHSEKIEKVSSTDVEAKPGEVPKESKKNLESGAKFRHDNDTERFAKGGASQMTKVLYPSTQSGVRSPVTVTSKQDIAHDVSQPSSFSRAVDLEFRQMFTRLTNEKRRDMTKCQSSMCQNYSNRQKGAYCNSCFSTLSDKGKHVAIFGRTESG